MRRSPGASTTVQLREGTDNGSMHAGRARRSTIWRPCKTPGKRRAPAGGWRRPQALQRMVATAAASSGWSSSASWHFLHAYTCPQHGATTAHLHPAGAKLRTPFPHAWSGTHGCGVVGQDFWLRCCLSSAASSAMPPRSHAQGPACHSHCKQQEQVCKKQEHTPS